jgi:hypothetical protein
MNKIRAWADDTLFGPETARRLMVVHIGLSLIIAYRLIGYPYWQLADAPPALVDAVPVLGWVDQMPSAEVFVALQVVGFGAALAAALRKRPKLAFALAWVCLLVLAGLRGSRGKVLHNDLLLLWASAPFLLAPAVIDIRDRVARRVYGWPIRSAIVIVALIYLAAGVKKLVSSGPAWVFSDNMQYVMLWGPSVGQPKLPELTQWIGEHPWASILSAAGIIGIELTMPVVLFIRRLRPLYALAAVLLHLMTWVVLGLDYWSWILTVPLLFIDWPKVWDRTRAWRSRDTTLAEGAP